MSRLPLLAIFTLGCASSAGLEELSAIPADFPLELTGETGKITRSENAGQVSVDLVFETKSEAEKMWATLKDQAGAKHWKTQEPLPGRRKWEVVAYELPDTSRVEVGCCPARADRRHIALVSWWPASERGAQPE